ncbi:3-mercaptopyruvate sulfurtransferase [Kaistia dalseonensis]|uniref:Sulfurtransferase n=1 Tax=Kaistia dalseonensis TaxID=410840 RepID=A0ABU0H1P3_9HYPH|nr:3-mercaptopyruvate sulfurtransferase [Kaistia dalseonensis]MCX5493669.1 3-mercaptopyruvate sulfurtransferase [Kaistia dalseonensis]MDQ0436231.1 thiosulfate/3-mercaptopyruvate sulfurtransferase [Kaistia dalseonensis]
MTERADIFVSTEWLAAHLGDPSIAIVDGSWYLPTAGRNAATEYAAAHIPGAVFFDIDKVADTTSGLPHMLPSAELFAATVGAAGISDKQTIVVYDGAGLFSAARVWWTFRVFGAKDVRILDGGFPLWKTEGRPLESGLPSATAKTFHATLDSDAVRTIDDVKSVIADHSAQIVDARPADRFRGEAPEPRPGLRAGHMPGSHSVPFGEVVANGRLKSADDIKSVFAAADIDPSQPIVTSCGSGVSAAILSLALTTIGADKVSLYDGSWAEWGSKADTPVETGPA